MSRNRAERTDSQAVMGRAGRAKDVAKLFEVHQHKLHLARNESEFLSDAECILVLEGIAVVASVAALSAHDENSFLSLVWGREGEAPDQNLKLHGQVHEVVE